MHRTYQQAQVTKHTVTTHFKELSPGDTNVPLHCCNRKHGHVILNRITRHFHLLLKQLNNKIKA